MEQPRRPKGRPDGGQYANGGMDVTPAMPPATPIPQPITPTAVYPKGILDLGPAPGAFTLGPEAWNTLYGQELHDRIREGEKNGRFRGILGWNRKNTLEWEANRAMYAKGAILDPWLKNGKTRPTGPEECVRTTLRSLDHLLEAPALPDNGLGGEPRLLDERSTPIAPGYGAAWVLDKEDDLANAIHTQPKACSDAVLRLIDGSTPEEQKHIHDVLKRGLQVHARDRDGKVLGDPSPTYCALTDYVCWLTNGNTNKVDVDPQLFVVDPSTVDEDEQILDVDEDDLTSWNVFTRTGMDPWDDRLFGPDTFYGRPVRAGNIRR